MFNLIMGSFDWTDTEGSMDLGRMFELTDPGVEAMFKDGDAPAFERLARLPTLFMSEGEGDEPCYVGSIANVRAMNGVVRFDYMIDRRVAPLTNSIFYENRTRVDMNRTRNNFDFHRHHWAVKDVDLYRFLLQRTNPRRQRPSVFQIPEHENIMPLMVSVMMPFDAGFNSVYTAIDAAATGIGMLTRRADEIWEAPGVIQDVVNLIDRGRIVVCDLTGKNPNVLYEAGIAHTLGRDVIVITQNVQDVPFDLRHLRFLPYLNNAEGLAALTVGLQSRIQTIVGH